MKHLKFLLVGFILVLLLGACSDADVSSTDNPVQDSQEEQSADTEESAQETAEESSQEESTADEALGTRTNPIKPNEGAEIQTVIYDDAGNQVEATFTIGMGNFRRGEEAYQYLKSQNEFNQEPPEGYEWLLFDVKLDASISDPNVSYYVAPVFNVFTEDGSPVQQDIYPTFNSGEFGWVDIYDGGSVQGQQAVIVPAGEKVLIEMADFWYSVFFATE